MGLALASAALHRGADVTLVRGAASWDIPLGVKGITVDTASEMRSQMLECLRTADLIIMSAAVADVKPREYSREKLPKKSLPEALPLENVGDIIAELASSKGDNQKLIGFAAQTGDIVTPAREKLQRKNLDAIVANPIDEIGSGFGSDTNKAIYIDKKGQEIEIPMCSKLEMAHRILELGVSGKLSQSGLGVSPSRGTDVGVSVSGAISVLGVSPMRTWRSPKLFKTDFGLKLCDSSV